ncbi:MAG: hypothetical protein PHR53_07945 [Bacteroidales bacterium]|nr:hypothetical protein [Bacteroidales bacterium]
MNISSEYSLWLLVPCILLGLLYAGILYWRNRHDEFTERLRWILFTLRTVTVTFIAFLLLGPLVHSDQYTDVKPSIVVAVDGSSSIGKVLSQNDQQQLLNDIRQIETALSNDFDIHFYTFGTEIISALPDSFSMPLTNMESLFDHIDIQHSNTHLGSVVLVSDGINNTGIDPLFASNHLTVPAVTLLVGDTIPHIDLALSKVTVNSKAFKNNQFPIRVFISGYMAGGQQTILRLKKDDRVLEEIKLSIRNDRYSTTHIFYPTADSVGLHRYTIELDAIDQESNRDNNRQNVVVEVLERQQKALLVAHAPHPDLAAIKEILESSIAFEVETAMASTPQLSPDKYDVVILHQLPSLTYPMESLLQKCSETRTPVLFVIGQSTNISRFNQLRTGLTIEQQNNLTEDATPAFNHAFRSFQTDAVVAEDCSQWTPLTVPFGAYKLSNAASVLMFQKIGNITMEYPLIAFNNTINGRYGFIAGEGLWRWRLNTAKRLGNSRPINDLILKTIQFLASDEKNQRFRVYCENQFASFDRIVYKAELYNEMFEPITTENVQLVIRDEAGLEYDYLFGIDGDNYKLDAGSFPAGSYRWEATTKVDQQNFTERGHFIVSATNIENEQLCANVTLMKKLAENHQGQFFFWEPKSEQVIQYLKDNISTKRIRYTTTGYYELIKLPWLLLVIVLLLTLEWFFRKFNGSY